MHGANSLPTGSIGARQVDEPFSSTTSFGKTTLAGLSDLKFPVGYFKLVTISPVALLKMSAHAVSGGNIEIMGLLQGRVVGETFLVEDSFRLPVEGTETRVNAGEAANEYMVQYTELNELTKFSSAPVIGWYHSHPGYGCWLSGIDVATQMLYQEHQDPFLAVVIDPLRTMESGRVEIGAFRTFPSGHKGEDPTGGNSTSSQVPQDRIAAFGMHSDKYYSLKVNYKLSHEERVALQAMSRHNWVDSLGNCSSLDSRTRRLRTLKDSLDSAKKLANEEQGSSQQLSGSLRECANDFLQESAKSVVKANLFSRLSTRMGD